MQFGQPPVLWGVMFSDGSVMSRWSGRTQQERATAAVTKLNKEYPTENITLAYRAEPGKPWVRVSLDEQEDPWQVIAAT